jgi:hypothetical protein
LNTEKRDATRKQNLAPPYIILLITALFDTRIASVQNVGRTTSQPQGRVEGTPLLRSAETLLTMHRGAGKLSV